MKVTFSPYTIASNCTDVTDCNTGLDELYEGFDKYKKAGQRAPEFIFSRIEKLEQKRDRLSVKENGMKYDDYLKSKNNIMDNTKNRMYRTQERDDDGLWDGIKRLFGGGKDSDKKNRNVEPEKGDEIVFKRASGSKDYGTVESVFKNMTDKGRDYGVKVKGSKDNIVVPGENVEEVKDDKKNNTMKNRMYRVSDADKKNYKFTFKCSAAKEPSVYYNDKFESEYEYDDFKECKKAATAQGETFCKEMVEKYGLSKVFKADVSIYILEDGNWEWLDGVEVYPNEDGTYKIDDSKKNNTMKQIKDSANVDLYGLDVKVIDTEVSADGKGYSPTINEYFGKGDFMSFSDFVDLCKDLQEATNTYCTATNMYRGYAILFHSLTEQGLYNDGMYIGAVIVDLVLSPNNETIDAVLNAIND